MGWLQCLWFARLFNRKYLRTSYEPTQGNWVWIAGARLYRSIYSLSLSFSPFLTFSFFHHFENGSELEILWLQFQKIDLVYFTGDFLDHFQWNTTQDYVKQSLEFVTNVFKNYFSDVPVVPILGNHDVHPANS